MLGKTNATVNSGGSGGGGGNLVYAEDNLIQLSAAGDKVLLRKFVATPESNLINYWVSGDNDYFSPSGIVKNNMVFSIINKRNIEVDVSLSRINDDLTVSTITNLSYYQTASGSYTYVNTLQTFLLGDWLFYKINNFCYAVNIRTFYNLSFQAFIYSGFENYFYRQGVGYGNDQKIYKFNTQTGSMEDYCTVFPSVGSYYYYYPLGFYKNYHLCFYYNGRYPDPTMYLYKVDPETKEVTRVASFGNMEDLFTYNDTTLPTIPLYPGYYFINSSTPYVLKIDDENETVIYRPMNCLGFEGQLYAGHYNSINQTFTVSKKDENDHQMLYILKFNPDNWTVLEMINTIDLTNTFEQIRNENSWESCSLIFYSAVSDDLNRIFVVLGENTGDLHQYLINFNNNLTDWQVVDNANYNYDELTFTAFLTGNTDEDDKLEVKTILPDKINVVLSTGDIDATISVKGND